MKIIFFSLITWICSSAYAQPPANGTRQPKNALPNIIIIFADDVGYGDISSYGAHKIKTPHIDQLTFRGLRFTNAYATASTCTPSRYSLLTGTYAWRQEGTGIAPGNASLLIPSGKTTIASMLQSAGYYTGVVGKWHLGLGGKEGPDWNQTITPGPAEVGFNYSFIIPATADRVPCVFVENGRVRFLDPNDPIRVSYNGPIGDEPTGLKNPELLILKPSMGHNQTIINGISRIGYMSGGKAARWNDSLIGDELTAHAIHFINENHSHPFFLYFALHGIHVPRVPNARFAGKSDMGSRGDAILEMDDMVGRIQKTLDSLSLGKNTLIIYSSDNGPVLDDGYQDRARELAGDHKPGGIFRGGKYSALEAGTRVPFITVWPEKIAAGKINQANISQVDLYASLAALAGQKIVKDQAGDSHDLLGVLLGKQLTDQRIIVQQSENNTLSIIDQQWKYIEPHDGPAHDQLSQIDLGNSLIPQLYNLQKDPAEKINLADKYPAVVKKMAALLADVKKGPH